MRLFLSLFLSLHILGVTAFTSTKSSFFQDSTSLHSVVAEPWVESKVWEWQGHSIRYAETGEKSGPPIVLIHGFGASLDYYRKQQYTFAEEGYNVFSIDLLGFGGSDKALTPSYGAANGETGYSSTLWTKQILDFCREQVTGKELPILVGNSIGSRIALECAATAPETIKGLLLYNAAAGINNKFTLTDELTPPLVKWLIARPLFSLLDILLRQPSFANWLFERTRKPENIRKTLQSVYVNQDAVDDVLVSSIAAPATDPRALQVGDMKYLVSPSTTYDASVFKAPLRSPFSFSPRFSWKFSLHTPGPLLTPLWIAYSAPFSSSGATKIPSHHLMALTANIFPRCAPSDRPK
jgi:pimeloyl-ACP methyl ester carboxylesterase